MKKILLTIVFCYSVNVFAQSKSKTDSIYYLFDTVTVATNARMWNVYGDDPDKFYVIQCSCLKGNGNPTFYRLDKDKGHSIDKKTFEKLNRISLPALIERSKQYLDKNGVRPSDSFFLLNSKAKNTLFII